MGNANWEKEKGKGIYISGAELANELIKVYLYMHIESQINPINWLKRETIFEKDWTLNKSKRINGKRAHCVLSKLLHNEFSWKARKVARLSTMVYPMLYFY